MSWSAKYKKSINCKQPKGFSQRAHCDGRKKRQRGESIMFKSVNEQLLKEVELFLEENCPKDPSKWSYYKSQAKKKFDVYPSAYANAWAAKQYKEAGGGWKKCPKKESVNERYRPNLDSKGWDAAQKVIRQLQSSVFKKLDDDELLEFRKAIADAFNLDGILK